MMSKVILGSSSYPLTSYLELHLQKLVQAVSKNVVSWVDSLTSPVEAVHKCFVSAALHHSKSKESAWLLTKEDTVYSITCGLLLFCREMKLAT